MQTDSPNNIYACLFEVIRPYEYELLVENCITAIFLCVATLPYQLVSELSVLRGPFPVAK